MPRRDSRSNPYPFDLKLFEPTLLRDASSLETALQSVARCVRNATIDSAIESMLTLPHIVEFVWSASDEETAAALTEGILNGFPVSPDTFANSLAYKFDTPNELAEYRRDVELTLPVLNSLASISSWEGEAPLPTEEDEISEINIKVKKSQRQRKQSKRAGRRGSILDSKPFDNLKVSVPTSSAEANELATNLLFDQKVILQYYLDVLRRPNLAETFKRLYIPDEVAVETPVLEYDATGEAANNSISEPEAPSAYPMVQPMKAALYFESAEGFGEWRILMSTKAEKNLREYRKQDANMFKIIVKKIKELSNGHFSDDNQKRLTGPHTEIPIFEAKMTRDTRLVYQVDCIPEYDSDVERQVIKIFGVYTHAQLDNRFWDSMGHQLSTKGKEYRQRCIFRNRPHHKGDNVIMPATFPGPPEDAPGEIKPLMDLRKEDLEELHSLLVLEKFVMFSQALLNSILADHDVAHVFNVSPQEKHIIEHASSCYVLGRSGTGKTTTMLFKMLGIQRSWQILQGSMPKPRQLFVTQSRVLAGKVEEYFSKLIESLVTAAHSPQELKKLVANKTQQGEELIDEDDEADWRSDLPKKFSLLEDDHFPMFITFDRLCALLEADIDILSRPADSSSSSHDANQISPMSPVTPMDLRFGNAGFASEKTSSSDYMQQRRASFVSYGTFLEAYWYHFPQSLTKGLDPSLVFSEFMGVIKGSEQTLDRPDGYLDRAAYENLSHRSQATFSNQRDHIYTLFMAYLKRKRTRGDYDAADRTHLIVKHIRENGMFAQKIDFLYVDEVQDNLLVDSLLLRSICGNPNGLFWAGDTAQTISVGSAFKFTDLKAFQYRIEQQLLDQHRITSVPPHEFQLTVNYRSHGGIVNCAHSVVELITSFWPYSIDILAPERGIVNGLKPIFFTGWDQDTVRYEQFLFGSAGAQIEFGAQQCILVRHDEARNKLRAQVGDIGLIMTLYESKGLEFNDVLLYNFFEDSTAELSQWRVVLNAIDRAQRENMPAPRFDDNKHAGICSELKFLYVAITRARKNLWVVDRSEKGEPMRVYWTSKDQVENCDPSSQVPHLAVSSTPEEWVKTGETLFKNKRYLQAMHSFERADRPREAAVAFAYYLREQARLIPQPTRLGNSEKSKAYIKAAEAFNSCAANAEVGQKRQRTVWFRIAAECFVNAGEEGKAAESYVNAAEYTLGARYYRKAGMFEHVVEVIQKNQKKIDHDTAEQLMNVSKIFYFKKNKLAEAVKLFDSDEDALDFMETFDLDIARATMLETLGRTSEAADLHLEEGRTLEAITLLIADPNNQELVRRGSEWLLQGLWKNLSFATVVSDQSSPILSGLLALANKLDDKFLSENDSNEIAMFRCIAARDRAQLPTIAHKFRSTENRVAMLLCLDHHFETSPKLQTAGATEVVNLLLMFEQYVGLLRLVSLSPTSREPTKKLFGFTTSEEHTYFLPTGTFFNNAGLDSRYKVIQSDETGITMSEYEFSRLFQDTLLKRLRKRILLENEVCQATKVFTPCLNYSLNDGQCSKPNCHDEHVPATNLTTEWYTTRIRLHLLQILIIQTCDLQSKEKYDYHRYWLGQLYETLHPAFFKHGSAANLEFKKIPEADRALSVVKEWISQVLYMVEPQSNGFRHYVTTIMRTATLGFVFDPVATERCLVRSSCYVTQRLPSLIRNKQRPVIHDLISSLKGDESSLSCGVLFLIHITENRIPVDIAALCTYMENIYASLIISRRYQSGGDAILHDIALPRSWFTQVSRFFGQFPILDTRMVFMALKIVPHLLEALTPGDDLSSNQYFLLYEGHGLTRSQVIQQNFIARICRTTVLFIYNMRLNFATKTFYVHMFSKLPKHRKPVAYSQYANATSWEDLVKAMSNSMRGSSLDELIRLEHSTKRTTLHPKWCRTITFQTMDQIPDIIRSGASGPPSMLRAEATAFVPRSVLSAAASAAANLDGDDDTPAAQDGSEEIVEEAVDMEAISRTMDSDTVVGETVSDEHRKAASVFLKLYRARNRRQAGSKKVLAATRIRLFNDCFSASAELESVHPHHYRHLFLGPLPHLLLCLEGAVAYARTSKNNTKNRMKKAVHQEYEEVMLLQTKFGNLLNKAYKLQKLVTTASGLHRKRETRLAELKARVLEIEALMSELPPNIQQEYEEDLHLGVTAIARPREAVKRKKLKPELVVETDLEI